MHWAKLSAISKIMLILNRTVLTKEDVLITAKETKQLEVVPDRSSIYADGSDLCFISIQAQDEHGVHVYDEQCEVAVKLNSGGTLVALGNADPSPESIRPYTSDICTLYHGKLMAVIQGTKGCEKCRLEISAENGIKESLEIAMIQTEESGNKLVSDTVSGPRDYPFGKLLNNAKAVSVLNVFVKELLENPMLDMMKEMSLKKLLSMSGTEIPEELKTAVEGVERCIRDGIPVKGYLYWSLLDNFEWQKGFAITFGLIAVDRSTQTRYPRPSLKYLGSFA